MMSKDGIGHLSSFSGAGTTAQLSTYGLSGAFLLS